ncbi:MAG: hypothetical protein WBV94_04890 [Blastocatellia bacterium]
MSNDIIPTSQLNNGEVQKEESKKYPPLGQWIKEQIHSFRGGAFVALTLLSTGWNILAPSKIWNWEPNNYLPTLYAVQGGIILVIFAIIAFGKSPVLYPEKYPRGSKAVEQFWKWWPSLWFAWLFLYVCLTLDSIYVSEGKLIEGNEIKIVLHTFNNCATLVLLMLYHLLAEPSISDRYAPEGRAFGDRERNIPEPERQPVQPPDSVNTSGAKFLFWAGLVIAATLVDAILLVQPDNINWSERYFVFSLAFGILAAVATTLVVGQLDSNLFGIHPLIIGAFFLFAAIQPSFEFIINSKLFGNDENSELIRITRVIIITIAMLSKVLLFVVFHWLATTGNLLFYMVEKNTIYQRVAGERKLFNAGLEQETKRKNAELTTEFLQRAEKWNPEDWDIFLQTLKEQGHGKRRE